MIDPTEATRPKPPTELAALKRAAKANGYWHHIEPFAKARDECERQYQEKIVEIGCLRDVLQDVIDDMTFNVAPSQATMAKIEEALS